MALYHNHRREGNSARKQFSFQHRFFGTLIIASSLILCTSMSAFMVLLIQMLLSFLSEQNVCSSISTAIQTSGTLTWLCQHSGQTCERCNSEVAGFQTINHTSHHMKMFLSRATFLITLRIKL